MVQHIEPPTFLCGFKDVQYIHKSEVIEIPQDAGLVPIPHTDRKYMSTNLLMTALKEKKIS